MSKLEWHQEERWNAKGADNHFLKVYPTMNSDTFSAGCTHMDDEGQVESIPIGSEYDTPQDAQDEAEKWLDDHLSKLAKMRAKKTAAQTPAAKTASAGNGG